MARTNLSVLEHIVAYCKDIAAARERFGDKYENLQQDKDYRNTVSLSLLQIGELSTHLTDDFKQATASDIPWRDIKALRNIVAHAYGSIDLPTVWDVMQHDIPTLQNFCKQTIELHRLADKEAESTPEDEDEMDLE